MAKEETGQLPAIPVLVHGAENRIKIGLKVNVNRERYTEEIVLDVMFSTFSLDKICSYGIIYLPKKSIQ